ncbi:MAG: TRAP transporter large permease [Lachnospiraceae bacterium]|nr:TRAP transporter large permease [Lachnospiraceae bacterium]
MALQVGFILLFGFLILLFLGVPIAIGLAIPSIAAMVITLYTFDVAAFSGAQALFTNMSSFTLNAIPFFVLSGVMMSHGGISRRLINFAKLLIGRLPGSLAHTNILSNMLFGAISGSAVASATSIGGVMKPLQDEEGYDPEFSTAVNAVSAPTGLLIPPSNTLILYSVVSGGTSIATLFVAGYVPGILWGLSCMVMAYFIARKKGYPVGEKVGMKEAARITVQALPALSLIIIVVGGIIFGFFTPTEGSAIAVFYALILMLCYRTFSIKDIPAMLLQTAKTTGTVMFLIGASSMMIHIMTIAGIPNAIAKAILSITENPYIIMLILILFLLFIGTFMDIAPAVLIFTPIFLPVVKNFGMDVVHFGVFITFAMCIGGITPPVGNILFAASAVSKVPIEKVIRPMLPFFVSILAVLLLVAYIPALSLALPKLLGLM